MTTTWTISIDWNRDDTYTDETARVLSARWFLGFQQPGNSSQVHDNAVISEGVFMPPPQLMSQQAIR